MILAQVPECDVSTWPEVANNAIFGVVILGVAFAIVWFMVKAIG